MADLDDFFAKKDRKKSKGKKFMTTEEIAKKLEETGKKVEKPKKDKPIIQTAITGQDGEDLSANVPEEEDEWKDFEEEKKDYTGLKIQNLTMQNLNDDDNNLGENEGDMEENEQGEMVPKKKGPWKMIDNVDSSASVPAPAPVEEKPKVETTNPPSSGRSAGKYVPPVMRNQPQAFREKPTKTKPGAPDITNQDYFPTLSAASSESSGSWNRRKQEGAFEEVRNSRSHSNRSEANRAPQSLQIGNKFGALESEHS